MLILACLCLGWSAPSPTFANDKPVTVYLFWTKGCPHCLHEKEFLATLERRDQDIKVVALELSASRENLELFQKVGKVLKADVSGVPFTVIGNQYVIGWQDEATTGRAIETAIGEARRQAAPDVVAGLMAAPGPAPPHRADKPTVPETLTLPVFGQVNLKYLSLGAITVIIGALDGFNPCAMWVLVFLINLLLGLGRPEKDVDPGERLYHRLGGRLLPVHDRLAEYPDIFGIYLLDQDHYRRRGPVGRGL